MQSRRDSESPTPTIENYLKTIHSLQDAEGLVRPTAIADAMGVAGPTVTVTLRRIEEAGWVERLERQVRLTPLGVAHATAVARRRDVGEAFLELMLGLPHDVAVREACELEHALSAQAVEALEQQLELHRDPAGTTLSQTRRTK